MRFRYIVTYDITDNKRVKKIFKRMKNWGDHVQYSVFFCELSDKEKAQMFLDLTDVINTEDDQVLIIRLGPVDGREKDAVETLGRKFVLTERSAKII